jgi:hypothetical protein
MDYLPLKMLIATPVSTPQRMQRKPAKFICHSGIPKEFSSHNFRYKILKCWNFRIT